jgi:hypothetical protein
LQKKENKIFSLLSTEFPAFAKKLNHRGFAKYASTLIQAYPLGKTNHKTMEVQNEHS